jgi:hypothetical protein
MRYAMSDRATTFATLSPDAVLSSMERGNGEQSRTGGDENQGPGEDCR